MLLIFNNVYCQNNEVTLQKSENDYEYNYAFIEATKQVVNKNYIQALNIYQRCFEYNPGSAALNFQLSKLYYLFGKQNEAIYHARKAVEIDKNNKWYLINLLNIYQSANQIDSALKVNYRLIDIEKENLSNLLNIAILYQIKKEYKKALEIYERIEEENNGIKETYINKYNIFRNFNKNKKALKELKDGLGNIPGNNEILKLIAEFYRDKKKYNRANIIYNNLLENDNNIYNYFSYIEFLIKSKNQEKALYEIKHLIENKSYQTNQIIFNIIRLIENTSNSYENKILFDKVVNILYEINKDDVNVLRFYVDYEIKEKNYEKASDKIKTLINIEENNYNYWEQLLFIENYLKRYENVLKFSERAIELFKNQPVLYIYRGLAFQQLNEQEKAIDILEKGKNINENGNLQLQFYILLAESYYKIKDYENSFKNFEKALNVDENNIVLRNNYAYYLALQEKELEKAEKLSKYTIERDKKNFIYIDTYAFIMFKLNNLKEAKYYIKKAIKYGGKSNEEIIEHYNQIMQKK
jgi:tetratricopeptide (TPR) repeat protein